MGTSSYPFDPRKTATFETAEVRRAVMWENVKIYGTVFLIFGLTLAMAVWALVEHW